MTIVAPDQTPFTGPDLQVALETFNLEYGTMRVFHYFAGAADGRSDGPVSPVFSVANGVEPGTFEFEDLGALTTTGLCLFMQVPGPIDGTLAFDLMLDVANKLACELGGELRDGRRSTLTGQGIARMREQVLEHRALAARRMAAGASPQRG